MCPVLFPLPDDLLTPFQQATKPLKSKSQENKTTRIAQNELLDKIFQCFRQYQYWPFRSLKHQLQQPEAYLKQTLEMVAHLIKSGDHSMTWQLKPEAQEKNYANSFADAKAELAPEPENYDDGSEDDPTASGVDEMQF
jgi:transcription initiation factor TFIIF subunit beta